MRTRKMTVGAALFAAAVVIGASADGIVWEQAKNITGDADVRTNGVLRYAYANKAACVNGVQFAEGVRKNYIPGNVATMADVALDNASSEYIDSNAFATTVPAGASEDYLQLIRAAVFAGSAVGEPVTSTVTLRNLIPGHAYIIQLWTNDSRNDPGDYRYVKVDDTEVLRLRTSNGFGQHITGAFMATGDSQSFTVVGYSERSDKAGVSQFASFQLRDVTPGCIDWEMAKDIVDDNDVRLDGEPVFAAGWTAATAVVKHVVFVPLAPTNSTTAYVDVRMTSENMQSSISGYNREAGQELSDDYYRLLDSGTYGIDGVSMVNIEGLMPGGRYLVQLWVNDTRSHVGPYRWVSIDGGRRLHYKNGTYGQHVTGVFTADASSKAIRIRSFRTSSVSAGSPQLNAIQLRRLDGGASTHWRVSLITKRDLDVRTDGDLLYAYNFGSTAMDTTVNGTLFAGLAHGNVSNDNVAYSIPGGHDTAYGITDPETDSAYLDMLKSSIYGNKQTLSTLTLKRLTPGHRYLVQLWVHDGRSTYNDIVNRYIEFDGLGEAARLVFCNVGVFSPARGGVATGLFTATTTTQAITIQAGHFLDEDKKCVQLNGMQVRDLGVAEGLTVLVEDVPSWHIAAGATVDLDGGARRLGAVSGEGTITNGTVVGTLALADGSAITLAAVTLSSGVTLNGASSVMFAGGTDLSGMAIHLANPVALAEMGRPVIVTDGTPTGVPNFTFGRGCYTAKLTEEGYVVQRIRSGLAISFH